MTVRLKRTGLRSGRRWKRNGRRIVHVEIANVRNDSETVWAVHSVDAVNVAAADVREGDQYVRGLADERDVDCATDADRRDRLRQTASERCDSRFADRRARSYRLGAF